MVAFPVPDVGVTAVSHAGLGLGRVMVHAPEQLMLNVALPAVAGIETLSGSRVMEAAAGADIVTVTVLDLPLIVTVPPEAEDEAVTVRVPLLLPLAGETV